MNEKSTGFGGCHGVMERDRFLQLGTHGWARKQYVKGRYNGSSTYLEGQDGDLQDSLIDIDHDSYEALYEWTGVKTSVNGRYEWIFDHKDSRGYDNYRLQYTEGTAVKAWMEAQDRLYLTELSEKPEHYERFLKELTPRERLSEADQKACLGLVMTDPHHQALAHEYADKKAKIERRLGIGSLDAFSGGGAAAVAEDPEMGRVFAEAAPLREGLFQSIEKLEQPMVYGEALVTYREAHPSQPAAQALMFLSGSRGEYAAEREALPAAAGAGAATATATGAGGVG
jgi:hypothetical protein